MSEITEITKNWGLSPKVKTSSSNTTDWFVPHPILVLFLEWVENFNDAFN